MSPAGNGAFNPKVMTGLYLWCCWGYWFNSVMTGKKYRGSTVPVEFFLLFFKSSLQAWLVLYLEKGIAHSECCFLMCILADKYIQMLPFFQWWQNGLGSWITESTKPSLVCPSHLLLGEYYCCKLGWNYTVYELNLKKTGLLVQHVYIYKAIGLTVLPVFLFLRLAL